MSNVLRFSSHARATTAPGQLAPLLAAFARHRRRPGDAFWLKENAELLGILAACNRKLPDLALAVYEPLYDGIAAQLAFHPQYYRMLLSLTLSLEALGYPGGKSAGLADWIMAAGWPQTEVNDLQRAETRLLLARAGQRADMPGLDARLLGFISQSEAFAIPNPRAAYDLLHVVFYLSDYGRQPLDLPQPACDSLHLLGCLAHLDGNGDLLAEVCLALRFAGLPQPTLWRQHVEAEAAQFRIEALPCADSSDAYHNYLVNRWLIDANGGQGFSDSFPVGPMQFSLPRNMISPLREWSQALLSLGATRSSDYAAMRAACLPRLSPQAVAQADAGAETPYFQRFFAAFARASVPFCSPVPLRRVGA